MREVERLCKAGISWDEIAKSDLFLYKTRYGLSAAYRRTLERLKAQQ